MICVQKEKVYVEYGKVTKYFIEDWIDRKVSFSTKITNAKAMVQLILDDGTKADMVDVYFLEYINNNNAYTAPPVGSGKISFWTSWKIRGIWNYILTECMLANSQAILLTAHQIVVNKAHNSNIQTWDI